jgi:AraC-like DNA-binding protein
LYQRQLRWLKIPAFRARILSQVLTEAGIVHEPPLVDLGGEAPGGVTLISAEREVEFQYCFAQLTADRPDLWIRAGARLTPLCYGLHGLAAMSAPTLEDLWTMLEQTREISISFNAYRALRDGDDLVGVEIDDRELPAKLRPFTFCMEVAAMITTLRELSAGSLVPDRAELPLEKPANTDFVRELGVDVLFNCAHARLLWPKGMASRPLLHGNAFLHRHYVEQCHRLVETVRGSDIGARILAVMADGTLDLEAVARKLNLSERTLQRRLHEDGLSFRELSNEALMRRAKTLLSHQNLSVGEVATRLGYAEIASFTRAFQRWTGHSPRAFRKRTRSLVPALQ